MRNKYLLSSLCVLLCTLSAATLIEAVEINHDVPYLEQRHYNGIGESACGPTSLAMLLRYYYPNSSIDVNEIYHAGLQGYSYHGPSIGYRNLSWGGGWTTDPGYSAIPDGFGQYYPSTGYSGIRDGSVIPNYLSRIWGINSQLINNRDDLLNALDDGPVLGHVWGHGNAADQWGHYLVIRGYDDDTEEIIVNDPYDQWSSSDSGGENKRISYHDFFISGTHGSAWFRDALRLLPQDTGTQRLHTVIVDTGHNSVSGNNGVHNFHVDDPYAQNNNGEYIWKLYYGSLGDWFYPIEDGHAARWTPVLSPGHYQISVKYRADSDSGEVTYSVYDDTDTEILNTTIDQHQDNAQWTWGIIAADIELSNGSYVRASDISANTNIDAVKFKFLTNTVPPAITDLTSGQQVSGSVSQGDWKQYQITASSSDTELQVDLSNLSADVDLYVRKDSSPTLTSYDCRPYKGGTISESCTLPNSGETTWYISVYGYQAGSFDIEATLSFEDPDNIMPLTSGEQVSDSAGYHLWKKYKITSSSSDTQLQVDMTGLSADVDLYVQQGAEPTLSSYACRPYSPGTMSESCTLTNSGATEWYISVYGYQAGDFDLEATLSSEAPDNVTPLTSGEQVSGSAGYHAWKKYKITSSSSDIELQVDMTSLSADVDLYVQQGAEPTLSSYACRPYSPGTTSESCTLTNNGATEWYISVYGYQAGDFDLEATLSGISGGNITPLTSGEQISDSAGYHAWKKYKITSSSSDTQLQVDMTGLSADIDLYVQQGAEPTLSSYACRPYSGGTISESCTLTNNGVTEWYISVYGFQAGDFDLEATLSGNTVTTLTSGEQISDSAEYQSWTHYKIAASSSDTELQVDLTGLSADIDLYVKQGAMPTLSSYDCRPYRGGTTSENCTLSNSGNTDWYISVYGYQAGSFDLKAVLSGGSTSSFPDPTLVDAFVTDNTGECIDTDGWYGCQCVDLMHWYVAEVLGIPTNAQGSIGGNAYPIYTNIGDSVTLSSGNRTVRLEKIANTPSGVPQKGDIIFWDPTVTSDPDDNYGHVAIFISGDINNFISFDQNWCSDCSNGSPGAVINHNYTSVVGWLRPVLVSP